MNSQVLMERWGTWRKYEKVERRDMSHTTLFPLAFVDLNRFVSILILCHLHKRQRNI